MVSISHAIAYGMHNEVCIGIPHGQTTMSHENMLCPFDHVMCASYQMVGIHMQHSPDVNTGFQLL